jgi:hypothetical protein
MKLWQAVTLGIPLSILGNLGAAAFGITLELNVLPALDSTGQCPLQLVAYETLRPYSEGGYARDGMIQLSEIATDIELTDSAPFSATWVGTLKPQYSECQGTAIINNIDGEVFSGQSYLRVQLVDGQASVRLDMTGIPDANGFTSTLLSSEVSDGNPRWAWGGTD